MRRITLIKLFILSIIATGAAFEIARPINIEIDVLWNATAASTGAPGSAMAKGSGSSQPTTISTRSSTWVPRKPLDGQFTAFRAGEQPSQWLPTGRLMHPTASSGFSLPLFSGNPGIASQLNESLWPTGDLRPTAQASPSAFSGSAMGSATWGESVEYLALFGYLVAQFI